jgi:GGDEF domain-containing protein
MVLLDVLVVFGTRVVADVVTSDVVPSEVDSVSGLPTRDSFYERTATMLGARHREDDRYLVLALVDIDSVGAIAELQGARGVHRAVADAAQSVRESVRRDAVVAHVGEAEFAIADTFSDDDPSPLVERLRGAIAAAPCGMTASIGVVSTKLSPLAGRPPDEVLDAVMARAAEAVGEARRSGGNRARYVVV